MTQIYRLTLCLSLAAALSFNALADGPGSATQSPSGVDNSDFIWPNPHFNNGTIRTKPFVLKLEGGREDNSQGTHGYTLNGEARREFRSGWEEQDYNSRAEYGLYLNPGIRGRLDFEGTLSDGSPVRSELELSGFTLFKGRGKGGPHVDGTSTTSPENFDLSHGTLTRIQPQKCSDLYPFSAPTICQAGLPNDPNTWTEAQKAQYNSRTIPQYRYTGTPTATGEFLIGEFSGLYENDKWTDTQVTAAKITIAGLDGEVAFRMGTHVQIDLNALARIGLFLGNVRQSSTSAPAAGTVTAGGGGGLTLTHVGQFRNFMRVGYEFNVKHDWIWAEKGSSHTQTAHEVKLSELLDTPVTLSYTRASDAMDNGNDGTSKSVTSNLWKIGFDFY